MEGELKTH